MSVKEHLQDRYHHEHARRIAPSYEDDRKPFCSVIRPVETYPEVAVKHMRESNHPQQQPVFDRLHHLSTQRQLEGKKRREEIVKKQAERAFNRSGARFQNEDKISLERGADVYYRGMMHLVQKERRIARKAQQQHESYRTRLNLAQMIEYYFIMNDKVDFRDEADVYTEDGRDDHDRGL
eukprot:CAMPEP_0197246126 /NCGR_PEP_ID=MMETSP1429-20130617/10681_1 /TAXON_ID=49237 /ORGANISM="Chaetoceros  sp., Strain UNC1202" /LENGTH=178 /DNA_ID=CAMNT_0042706731 /DNA_START=35 /DNA_END=571 /DNA_ORIENTATION=-